MPKMNVNLYVIEDYENEPPSGPKKQTQFKPNLVRRRRIAKAKMNKKLLARKSGKFAIRKILGIFKLFLFLFDIAIEYANIYKYEKKNAFNIVSFLWPADADGSDVLRTLRGQN